MGGTEVVEEEEEELVVVLVDEGELLVVVVVCMKGGEISLRKGRERKWLNARSMKKWTTAA